MRVYLFYPPVVPERRIRRPNPSQPYKIPYSLARWLTIREAARERGREKIKDRKRKWHSKAGGITDRFQLISRSGGEIEDPRRHLT
jgi:hypothetical protein